VSGELAVFRRRHQARPLWWSPVGLK